MGRITSHRSAAIVGACLALAIGLGCAGDLKRRGRGPETVFQHKTRDYRIALPEATEEQHWSRIEVEGADLVFVADDGTTLTFISRCRAEPTRASPQLLARNLLIGSPEHRVIASGPVALGVAQGWRQTVDVLQDDVTVRLETVSLKSGACTFDWLLMSPRDEWVKPAIEAQFERWIASFYHPGMSGATTSTGSAEAPS